MWSLEPQFFDERGPLVSDLVPELSPEDGETWISASTAFPTLSITASVKGVALQSVNAAERYRRLRGLEDKYPGWMLLRVLLAEVHYLLFDKFGAQQRLLLVQDAVGHGKDERLDSAVIELAKIMEEEDDDEVEEEAEAGEGIEVTCYVRPRPFSSLPCFWSVEEIRQEWQVMEQSKTAASLAEFARYAAISTNVLEGVFSVEGHSMSRLVKRGFYVNSIEGISATSRIKKKAKIVQILNNTQSCFQYLRNAAVDEVMIQDLHRTLMEGNDLSQEIDDDDQVYVSLVPCGIYRRVPCYTTNEDLETRYCPWRQIPTELKWFFEEAQLAMADDSADPFLVSAWLHLAFLSIHPFADGNGRVGRMISSIPLIKAGLPPVVVPYERKEKYFDALIQARKSCDLLPLASFLKDEVDRAITHISTLVDDN